MSKKEKSTFSHFFKEDADTIQSIFNEVKEKENSIPAGLPKKEKFPKITRPEEITEEESIAHWRRIRAFFRNSDNTSGLPESFSPVVLAPWQTKNLVGTEFPIWVSGHHDHDGAPCLSLKEIIINTLSETAPGENDGHILKRNIERIIHIANNNLADQKPRLFRSAILQVLEELEKQLDIKGDECGVFKEDLRKFENALPSFGILLPYSINTSFLLLEAAMLETIAPAREKFKNEIRVLRSKLNDLLRVEREKGPERKDPEKLQETLSFVDSMVNFDELSSILPDAGSELLGEGRVQRITKVVQDLEEAEQMPDRHGFLFVDELLYANKNFDWVHLFENAEVETYQKGRGVDSAGAKFDEQIISWLRFFVAKRIGELELENHYQPDIHDEFFNHFNWESLSSDELNICPHVILIADDARLFETEYSKLSNMLSANVPIKVIAVKHDDFIDNQNMQDSGLHTNAQLSAMMLSHKNIFVAQSTSITPKYLFNGFNEGLSAFAPAFFYILNVDEEIHGNTFLWTSAVIEGRDFPGFTFKGLLGTPWGSRFEVGNNPQPSLSWPVHKLKIIDEEGNEQEMEITFTFADQAVLNPGYSRYFLPVSSSCWDENLVPLTNYMDDPPEENIGKVPFIWMVDAANELHKVAVSWQVVLATQERLDFWRFLQENSGINNYHVGLAVEKAKAELQEQHNQEIEQINEKHQGEIQKIRDEEAGIVMENLTSVLLNLDTTNFVTTDNPASKSKPETPLANEPEQAASEETPETPNEEEEVFSSEPYIDTALCTSCNECTNLNGAMFKYDANKMAYIADPKAGTFDELVRAAELCPVNIIHPGSPLNPDEPNIDDLIKRAEKFN